MVKMLLKRSLIVIVGSLIGLIGGIIIGLGISRVFDMVLKALYNPVPGGWSGGWLIFLGASISAWTGCIVGAGTSALGIRTVSGYEWAIITAVAYPLGCWITDIPWNWSGIFILAGVAATASWLIALIVRGILGSQLSKGPIHSGILAAYLLVLVLLMFSTPKILFALRVGLG